MTLVWIILATVAIWKWALKPLYRWAETTSFRGFQTVRGCERCGKPDKEVSVGFRMCRPCWEIETRENLARWNRSPLDLDA